MFADFVEFEFQGRLEAFNRLLVCNVCLYNSQGRFATTREALDAGEQRTTLYIKTMDNIDAVSFDFNSAEEALRVYNLIKNGN